MAPRRGLKILSSRPAAPGHTLPGPGKVHDSFESPRSTRSWAMDWNGNMAVELPPIGHIAEIAQEMSSTPADLSAEADRRFQPNFDI